LAPAGIERRDEGDQGSRERAVAALNLLEDMKAAAAPLREPALFW
jgi:hypothetical protein